MRKSALNLIIAAVAMFTVSVASAQNKKVLEPEMVFVQGNDTMNSFNIGKYPITQGEWKSVMGKNPSKFADGDNYPVEQVSWNDAQKFIKKLNARTGKNYRLPTEAEWKYAAGGGNKSRGYEYSGSNNIDDVAWYYDNSGGYSHPVGTKSPNELGIYDMSGNVCEWCQDWYIGSFRAALGGSWSNYASYCLVANRLGNNPDARDNDFGFRVVLQ